MEATVHLGPAARYADVVAAKFARQTIGITGATLEAHVAQTPFIVQTVVARGATLVLEAHLMRWTARGGRTVVHASLAPHQRCWIAFKIFGAGTGQIVLLHRAQCIGSANVLQFARIGAPILDANLTGRTLAILAAAHVTVALGEARLIP